MELTNTADAYKELYTELEGYEKKGISMMMNGTKASPLQIVTAHMVKEEGCYMRDYEVDSDGYIKSLMFVNIHGQDSGNYN